MKLPPGWSLTTLEPNPSTPLPDLRAAVEGALAQPLHSPRLSQLASTLMRVCLVFTDATRACPDHILVPAILRQLDRADVPVDHITLLCAAGLHRPSTRTEKIAIAQVDPPKDVNLYQASRAVTYVGLSATPPVCPGGVIIVAARCPEGAGQGRGEERFFAAQVLYLPHPMQTLPSITPRAQRRSPPSWRAILPRRSTWVHPAATDSSSMALSHCKPCTGICHRPSWWSKPFDAVKAG